MSVKSPLQIIVGEQQARQTVLRRRTLDDVEASPALQAEIEWLFGRPLTPDQVVAQILADVQAEGDSAVNRYSMLLDRGVVDQSGCLLNALRKPGSAPLALQRAYSMQPSVLRHSMKNNGKTLG